MFEREKTIHDLDRVVAVIVKKRDQLLETEHDNEKHRTCHHIQSKNESESCVYDLILSHSDVAVKQLQMKSRKY
jgi:hypothetical protein